MNDVVKTGLENCLATPPAQLAGRRLGVLMNQSSVDRQYQYACDLLSKRFPGQIQALFSPQHGFWCEQQANMVESPDARYAPLDLSVYSLYSETRRPTADMLSGIDCLIIDLQDVGTRVYTFVWTMLECLRACAQNGVAVLVLDRPNPLGGDVVEGPLLQKKFRSFVGGSEVPLRHGLTIGELALLLNTEEEIYADLTVVPMIGWQRSMVFPDTRLPWIPPSPNMPRWETSVIYPGQVLLEGTSLSEGRGTTIPFEIAGAPGLDAVSFCELIRRHKHPGIALQPVRFRPTFDKWADQTCEGVAIYITAPHEVRSVRLTLTMIDAALQLLPDEFAWLDPPYEYEHVIPPIDILFGSRRLRYRLTAGNPLSPEDLDNLVSLM